MSETRTSPGAMLRPRSMHSQTASPEAFAEVCRSYVENGVQIIGGCCGTTIEHIRAMVDALPDHVGPRPAA